MSVLEQYQLELYRYNIHNLTRPKHQLSYAWSSYWRLYGAFISVMPRAAGKTKMLEKISDNLVEKGEKVIAMFADQSMMGAQNKKFIGAKQTTVKEFLSLRTPSVHSLELNLIVDEFTAIDKLELSYILDREWKSVTMAGTL